MTINPAFFVKQCSLRISVLFLVLLKTRGNALEGKFRLFRESDFTSAQNRGNNEFDDSLNFGPIEKQLSKVSAGMEVTFAASGLEYAKDVLVSRVLNEIIPLHIPDIQSTAQSYYFGTVSIFLTNITLETADVSAADMDLEDGNITIIAQGIFSKLTFNWHYVYAGWLGDKGSADVKVSGMNAGIIFNLTSRNGTLEMTVLDNAVVIEQLSITLHNYYSWLYNWLVNSFHNHLRAAIESSINNNIVTASLKLNNYLQSFPRLVPVDGITAVNATISDNPVVQPNLMSFSPKGEFVPAKYSVSRSPASPPSIPTAAVCQEDGGKMISVTVTDFMINSAANVYFEAGALAFPVDHFPDSSPIRLNTASWRFILPKLYKKYPSQDMVLNFISTAAPLVLLEDSGLTTVVAADMVLQVVQPEAVTVDVACIGMNISLRGWAGMKGNNLTSSFQLDSLSLKLEWSTVGTVPIKSLQILTNTMMRGVIIPLANRRLMNGFPLPVIPSIDILNASIVYSQGYLTVCTDLEYTGGYFSFKENVIESV